MSLTLSRTQTQPVAAEQMLNFPGDARFELVNGKLIPVPPTGDAHGDRTIRLSGYIFSYIDQNELGGCFAAETGFLLARNPDVVLAPDFAFIVTSRLTYRCAEGFVPLAPDLFIETRSPCERPAAVASKMAMWLGYGVKLGIDVNPAHRELTLYRPDLDPTQLGIADILDGIDVLPGFSVPLARLSRN